MKNFIPIVSVIGLTSMLVCLDAPKTNVHNDFAQDFEYFAHTIETDPLKLMNTKKSINNYTLKLTTPVDATLVDAEENIITEEIDDIDNLPEDLENDDEQNEDIDQKNEENIDNNIFEDTVPDSNITEQENKESEENEENPSPSIIDEDQKLLTIYSLTKDIEENCDKYCQIKNLLNQAILETQTLIQQIKNNELDLNVEQRLLLNEQSNELKYLGQQLNRNTNELNIYLRDIDGYLTRENNDYDAVCLKYLLLLNNLNEGGNLMNNSLASLSMMNNIMRMRGEILPENNHARILYGFQKNDEPPVIKEYEVDENGLIIQKDSIETEENVPKTLEEVNGKIEENEKSKLDSYKTKKLKSNIDTYKNNYSNIDSFFNTALLDNEFMFGNGGMYQNNALYPMMYGGNVMGNNINNHPNNYNNNHSNQSRYGVDNKYDTPYNDKTQKVKKDKKIKKLKKNVDTYRDDTTPMPKQKFRNLKQAISNIFNKTSKDKLDELKK